MGLVFTPLQVLAFATLPASMRTEGASLFSLLRNIGAAIGNIESRRRCWRIIRRRCLEMIGARP